MLCDWMQPLFITFNSSYSFCLQEKSKDNILTIISKNVMQYWAPYVLTIKGATRFVEFV